MYGRTDVQISPVFYRTSSPPIPSGAAAQKGNRLLPSDDLFVIAALDSIDPSIIQSVTI